MDLRKVEWKLLPSVPSPEMREALAGWCTFVDRAYADLLAAAPDAPNDTMTAEEARSSQHWAGMDGAIAWHLIDRHANGWADVGKMMDAWLEANIAARAEKGQ